MKGRLKLALGAGIVVFWSIAAYAVTEEAVGITLGQVVGTFIAAGVLGLAGYNSRKRRR